MSQATAIFLRGLGGEPDPSTKLRVSFAVEKCFIEAKLIFKLKTLFLKSEIL